MFSFFVRGVSVPIARARQIFPEITPYYHCVSRCVRRAWLCGEDSHSGRNFDHRKKWIEKRLLFLGQVFAIDIAAYAVMSNHYHVVLHLKPELGKGWGMSEVIQRWGKLCRLPILASKYSKGETLEESQHAELHRLVVKWQKRLQNISWFMRFVNEPLARFANKEDKCTGRFWEGRFTSQALLDETAVLVCMAYVDLNPVRAGIARRPEAGPHTSWHRRVSHRRHGLQPFTSHEQDTPGALPIGEDAYADLIDWSSRIVATEKHSSPVTHEPSIVAKLGGRRSCAAQIIRRNRMGIFFGKAERLREICHAVGRAWLWGSGRSTAPYPT